MNDCLFCKVVAGKIPAKKVYEDERVFVFEDIKPQAPTHVLVVPKKHVVGLDQANEADTEIIGYCQLVAAKIARERGLENGFRTVYNVGPDAGQTVFHLHLHLLGGRRMRWPPGEFVSYPERNEGTLRALATLPAGKNIFLPIVNHVSPLRAHIRKSSSPSAERWAT